MTESVSVIQQQYIKTAQQQIMLAVRLEFFENKKLTTKKIKTKHRLYGSVMKMNCGSQSISPFDVIVLILT